MSERLSSKPKDLTRVRQKATNSTGESSRRGSSLESVREDEETKERKTMQSKSVGSRPKVVPINRSMIKVQEEKINVADVKNMKDIAALTSKILEENKNVVAVEGNLKKKLILSYLPPPPAPVTILKETKKKKKKKKRVELKSRGTVTLPPPITVDSGTWTPSPRTRSQSVSTNLCSADVGVQGEVVRKREFSTMTEERRKQAVTVGVGTATPEGGREERRVVTVNRGVQGELFIGEKEKERRRMVSVGVSYKPPTGTKSVGTEITRRTKMTETEITKVEDKGNTAVPSSTHCSTNTRTLQIENRGTVTNTQISHTKQLSTSDLRSFRDVGTISSRPPTGRARSTNTELKTGRHMAVGTSKTYHKDMTRLGNELEKMKGQRVELEKLTKQLIEDRDLAERRLLSLKPQKKVMKRYVVNCAYSTTPPRGNHPRNRQSSLVHLSSSSTSLSSAGSTRPRSRVHSMIISEPDKEEGWNVRVLTPAKLSDFNNQYITRDSHFY